MTDQPTRRGRIEDAHKRIAILLGDGSRPGLDYAFSVSFWLEPPESGKPSVPTFNTNFELGAKGLVTLTTWQWNADVPVQHELMLGSRKVSYTMLATSEHETLELPHFWTTELDAFFDVKDVEEFPPLVSDEERRTLQAEARRVVDTEERRRIEEERLPDDVTQRQEAALPGEDERKFYKDDKYRTPRTRLGSYEGQELSHNKAVEMVLEECPLLYPREPRAKKMESPVGAVKTRLGFSVSIDTGMYKEGRDAYNHALWIGNAVNPLIWNDEEHGHDSVPQNWKDDLSEYLGECRGRVLEVHAGRDEDEVHPEEMVIRFSRDELFAQEFKTDDGFEADFGKMLGLDKPVGTRKGAAICELVWDLVKDMSEREQAEEKSRRRVELFRTRWNVNTVK